ncbi:MAG: hypothetical protein EXR99_10050 [Gemmataceae bacterium]|nr:hypothetical protein [Gemmataceae bacterium]
MFLNCHPSVTLAPVWVLRAWPLDHLGWFNGPGFSFSLGNARLQLAKEWISLRDNATLLIPKNPEKSSPAVRHAGFVN